MGRTYETGNKSQILPFAGAEILSTISPPVLSISQNDYAPGGIQETSLVLVSASAPINITGLVSATPNREITLINVGASAITIKANSASSAVGNRFNVGADIVLAQWSGLKLIGNAAAQGWVSSAGAGSGGGGATTLAASIKNSVNQSIPQATVTPLSFDTLIFDTGLPATPFYNVADPTILTAPNTGIYLVCATCAWAASTLGEGLLSFGVNGAITLTQAQSLIPFAGPATTANSVTQLLSLSAGDTVSALAFQNGAGGGALNALAVGTIFGMMQVH